jgi:hypothetical protein
MTIAVGDVTQHVASERRGLQSISSARLARPDRANASL